jgi:hypothetical protein
MATRALAAQLRERSVCAGGAAQSRKDQQKATDQGEGSKWETVSSLGLDVTPRQSFLRVRH